MDKNPMEMAAEELDALYGKPQMLTTITHVLGVQANINHDLFTVEILTEDSKRLNVRFTQAALLNLVACVGDQLNTERPKAN